MFMKLLEVERWDFFCYVFFFSCFDGFGIYDQDIDRKFSQSLGLVSGICVI